MMEEPVIPRELEAKILRLHFAEDWPAGTIAAQVGVHHDVVDRVLAQGDGPRSRPARGMLIDPFRDFVVETWKKYPKLPASRLWRMCRARGYAGCEDHFRHAAAGLRPRRPAEAYLRLRTLPGEQAQVDWAHFGTVTIGRATRRLLAFVMVLSWSRAIFLRFYLGMQSENFLRGHEATFHFFGGVPRVLLYDNLKSAVLERKGDAIRLNPLLRDFAAHHRFNPRPVAPYRGNEKGRVERAIRYVRGAFFMARPWRGVDDLNAQAEAWCGDEALDRPWPDDPTMRVRDAFEQERTKLLDLRENGFPTDERREVRVGKTPYVRFDTNDYSVPHELARRTVVVVASLETVRIVSEGAEVARHARSFDKRAQIENAAHVAALAEVKRAARRERAMDRLTQAAPSSQALLERLAERGKSLGNATQRLVALLDTFGAVSLEEAIREALEHEAPHVHGVRQILERERHALAAPPALPVALPDDPRVRDLHVQPHDLESYDTLAAGGPEKEADNDSAK